MKTSNAILLTFLALLLVIELVSFFVVRSKIGTNDFTIKNKTNFEMKVKEPMK
ncbi:MAG TPA: hypothetical protein VK628_01485 [Flavitalea sp.]|nr:hypothetical protein [Flavitalea sp.]